MRIVTISGFSGVGKDSIAKRLSEKFRYKIVTSVTTRPMRSGDREGVDYYFISKQKFFDMIKNNELAEFRFYVTKVKGKKDIWWYGVPKSELHEDKTQIVVVDTVGLKQLRKNYVDNVVSIFINADENTRKQRAINRDKKFDIIEWNRRWEDDKRIFQNIESHNIDLIVENYDLDKCFKEIIEYLLENNIK